MLKVDLCETCSKAKGVQESAGFSWPDLLEGLSGVGETKTEGPGARCSVCGFSQADFKKTGRLGCSECWETFAAGLAPLLKAMHKSDRHVGKVPSKAAHTIVIGEKIKELTEELEKAIAAEKYEDAAHIRDQIRELESKLKVPSGAA
jgi:protein arginine kinase activator